MAAHFGWDLENRVVYWGGLIAFLVSLHVVELLLQKWFPEPFELRHHRRMWTYRFSDGAQAEEFAQLNGVTLNGDRG